MQRIFGSLIRSRLWIAWLLLSALPVLSQTYDVVGLVMDAEKGEPIGQVKISLQSGKVLGYSKSNGRFEITVNSHNVILLFTRNTYKPAELDLTDLTELIDVEVSMESDVQSTWPTRIPSPAGPSPGSWARPAPWRNWN